MVVTCQCPTKQTLIRVHSVFPLVYVCMRQQGAWKLHRHNCDAKKSVSYQNVCPFSSIWNKSYNLVAMMPAVTTVSNP